MGVQVGETVVAIPAHDEVPLFAAAHEGDRQLIDPGLPGRKQAGGGVVGAAQVQQKVIKLDGFNGRQLGVNR